jgi:uncharacterized protein DUF4388
MVEGDLVDLTLPSLLHALSREGSTAVLKVQRGTNQGALYFSEGALVHALSGKAVGDDAVYDLLTWPDGRFRLVRDADRQPRTITHRVTDFLNSALNGSSSSHVTAAQQPEKGGDEQLLTELLTLLTRLEQDRVRLAEGKVERDGVAALLVVTAVVNSLIAFVAARCSDPDVLPSRVLPRLAETQPYTQLLGEENERISVATAAGVLKTWNSKKEDRQCLFQDLCRALLDVLTMYCNTISTFFHGSREREEWKATFDVFVDGLWTAVQQVDAD